jgi:hypothetical protein
MKHGRIAHKCSGGEVKEEPADVDLMYLGNAESHLCAGVAEAFAMRT